MERLIEEFLAANRRRWSPKTIESYRWYLRDLDQRLRLAEGDIALRRVKERMLLRWLDGHPGWSPATTYTALIACRSFFAWAVGPERSPAQGITPRKPRPSPQRVLDEEKLARLLASFDTARPKGRRDLALVSLLLDTGLRSAEVCRLELRHVDIVHRHLAHLAVKRKGGRWGEAVFAPYVAACLGSWIATRERLGVPETCRELFVSIGGNKPHGALTTSGLRCLFREMGQALGFHFSPHDFRRTFATWAIRNGAPTKVVQVAGGWASVHELETRYTQAIQPEDIEPYSPVERLISGRHE